MSGTDHTEDRDVAADPAAASGTQMRKGVLPMLLLAVCAAEERYTREIRDGVRAAGLEVSDGALYPALRRLERAGMLRGRLVETTSGPARRYYRTTRLGGQELRRLERVWSELVEAVDCLTG